MGSMFHDMAISRLPSINLTIAVLETTRNTMPPPVIPSFINFFSNSLHNLSTAQIPHLFQINLTHPKPAKAPLIEALRSHALIQHEDFRV